MSIESINEPGGSRLVSYSPKSINEAPTVDEIDPPRATGMEPAGCAIGDRPSRCRCEGQTSTTTP